MPVGGRGVRGGEAGGFYELLVPMSTAITITLWKLIWQTIKMKKDTYPPTHQF